MNSNIKAILFCATIFKRKQKLNCHQIQIHKRFVRLVLQLLHITNFQNCIIRCTNDFVNQYSSLILVVLIVCVFYICAFLF